MVSINFETLEQLGGKFPRLEFFYSVGPAWNIVSGRLEKKLLPVGADIKGLLPKSFAYPTFVGIYQEERIDGLTSEREELYGMFKSGLLEETDQFLQSKGLRDPVHPKLVMVGYPEGDIDFLVRRDVRDALERVAIYSIGSMPNIYSKQEAAASMFEIIKKVNVHPDSLPKGLREELKERIINEESNALISRFAPEIEECISKMKKYGMTRNEWYDASLLH